MIVLFIILLLAVLFDLKEYRIPNKLILFGIFAGVFYHIFLPKEHIMYYIAPSFAILLIGIPTFKLNIIGAGDIKLFSVCALFWGVNPMRNIIGISFLVGAIYAFFVLMCHLIKSFILFKQISDQKTFLEFMKDKPTQKLHFSFFILLANLAEFVLFLKF